MKFPTIQRAEKLQLSLYKRLKNSGLKKDLVKSFKKKSKLSAQKTAIYFILTENMGMPRKTHNSMIIRIKQRRLSLYFSQDRRLFIVMNGGGEGSWTPVLVNTKADIYILSQYLLLIVTLALLTDKAAKLTIPSCKSRPMPKVTAPGQNALWHPDCLSIHQAADVAVKLSSQCVLFVRNYCFDRCFTRPTIILGMQSTPNAANRIRYTPEFLWLLL